MASSTSSDVTGDQSVQARQQFVCVKRPESSLNALFEHMYENERLVDVTLSCSNGQLQAHKLVLAACSTYFGDLFDKLANPFHYPVVIIKDMQIEDLRLLVEYMYKGQITINHDRVAEFVKCAENLQITGLSSLETLITNPVDKVDNNHTITINVEGPKKPNTIMNHRSISKRARRLAPAHIGPGFHNRTYHRLLNEDDIDSRHATGQLLDHPVIPSSDTLDSGNQFSATTYALATNSNHLTQAKNLIASNNHLSHGNSHQLHGNSVSSIQHIQHHLGMDSHTNSNNQQSSNHNLTDQLQVLSHSLAANRNSLPSHHTTTATNSHLGNHLTGAHHLSTSSSMVRGRLHPCNICWKTFREKANLKRHLQVHSIDRVVYACPDCNKTFSWKDNYIRHTKTAHHMNNVTRQQTT